MNKKDINHILLEITNDFKEAIQIGQAVKIIFSKGKSKANKRAIITPYVSKEEVMIKMVKSSPTQDFTSTFDPSMLYHELHQVSQEYLNIDFIGTNQDRSIRTSKKGRISEISKNKVQLNKDIQAHNVTKQYLIDANAPYLHLLGLTSQQGQLYAPSQKKYKQINRFVEIMDHMIGSQSVTSIVDMGCGKGYLTFAMYDHFTTLHPDQPIHITGYEIRSDLVDKCNHIAQQCQYNHLAFETKSIDQVSLDKVDVLVALHACDIATDMAIAAGVHAQAKFLILSPCCHKQIRKEMTKSNAITKYGIFEERMAEMITDTFRALLLEQVGYKTEIVEYISSEHTAKNTMILAHKSDQVVNHTEQIANLKEAYGIGQHYLEGLLRK